MAAGPRRPVVQRAVPRLPDRARVRPLLRGALARPAPVAPLLPPGAAAADRLARRGHRLPRPLPEPPRPVRLRRRRADRWLRRRGHRARPCGLRWSPDRAAAASASSATGSASRCCSSGSSHADRRPDRASGWSLNLHPTALAGWLGLLFTMMNLVPISQLDGGHIAYAAIRPSQPVAHAGRPRDAHLLHRLAGAPTPGSLWVVLLLVIMRLVGWEHPAGAR